MVASLLYYRMFTTSLSKEGYHMNPYNPCVWNKMIDGKMTICFHVDDCKLSHVSPKAIDKTIDWLRVLEPYPKGTYVTYPYLGSHCSRVIVLLRYTWVTEPVTR